MPSPMLCLISDIARAHVDETRAAAGLEPWPWIEDDMATYYCEPCKRRSQMREATIKVDGEPMCRFHQGTITHSKSVTEQLVAASIVPKPPSTGLCALGCGRPIHRGRCAGLQNAGKLVTKPGAPNPFVENPRTEVHRPARVPVEVSIVEPEDGDPGCFTSDGQALSVGCGLPKIEGMDLEFPEANAEADPGPDPVVADYLADEAKLIAEKMTFGKSLPPGYIEVDVVIPKEQMAAVLDGSSGVSVGYTVRDVQVDSIRIVPNPRNLDKLQSRTIKFSDIPPEAAAVKKSSGRLGEIWKALIALGEDEVEEVLNRDRAHATITLVHIRKRARLEGRTVKEKRSADGKVLWLWLEGE